LPLITVQKSGHCFVVSMQLWLPNAHRPVPTSVPQAQSASFLHDSEHVAPASLEALLSDALPP